MKFFLRFFLLLGAVFFVSNTYAEKIYQFKLNGPNNKIYTEKSFPKRYSLVVFGFTFCPDVCPTTLLKIHHILDSIKNPKVLQPIFITIDPKRDTVENLNKYTDFFDKRIIGLSGSSEDIERTAKNFNASYGFQLNGKKVNPEDLEDNNYTVYHSSYMYLLNDKGQLIDVFDYQSQLKELVKDIESAMGSQVHDEK